MINFGGAWKKKSDSGKEYINCKMSLPFIGDLYFQLWENENKQKENQPDYILSWSERKRNDGNENEPTF